MTVKDIKEIVTFAINVKNRERDSIRTELDEMLKSGQITRTEYDLIWDLTTNKSYKMARFYLDQATRKEA